MKEAIIRPNGDGWAVEDVATPDDRRRVTVETQGPLTVVDALALADAIEAAARYAEQHNLRACLTRA
jgi:hypothetical protein